MVDWREALRGLLLPAEVAVLVIALATFVFVVIRRGIGHVSLSRVHAWLIGTVLAVQVVVAVASRLWVGASALVVMLIVLVISARCGPDRPDNDPASRGGL